MYRDTVFTIIVHPEMYRDRVFTIVIHPEMYHDTVSFVVSSRLSCVLCFSVCTRASWVLFGLSNTRLSPDAFSKLSVESVQCGNESIGRQPVSRVVQRTLGKYAALFVGVDQVGT